MNIGNKIRELRKQRGITQEQLADSIGVSFQAVSKWEKNIALPDIALVPALASYFGVSTDVLFDFNLSEIEERALAIAKESWKYRHSDQAKARQILEDGLKLYPDKDILYNNLLYVTDDADEIIEIASKIIDITRDDAARYDAARFMAHAYKTKGDIESARRALDLIPEIYFSHLTEKAHILSGDESLAAAEKELSCSLRNALEMLEVMAERSMEKGDTEAAVRACNRMIQVVDLFEATNCWGWAKDHAVERLAQIRIRDAFGIITARWQCQFHHQEVALDRRLSSQCRRQIVC